MKDMTHSVDFCVVGGGMAGLCAAVSAARLGARVALVQDRPVLGGNASGEIRMWICGAHGDHNRETGLLEEIQLDNLHRNPTANWSIWDSILYEKARFQPNLTLLLNTTCTGLDMDGPRIRALHAWGFTNETRHRIESPLYADCSGDAILAPLSGAEFRVGREARAEFNEDIEPETADRRTMGMSCLMTVRETDRPQAFIPPAWAHVYRTDDELPHRDHRVTHRDGKANHNNFWWIELGGEQDSIHDAEAVRDELLKVTFGVWDHIKNRGDHGADNWVLDWVGFLPGKRESRRYIGDHVLTQNDVRAEGRFDDLVAYGGWSMDDHHPAGFRHPGKPTIFHPAPSPYGIPYRSLYSRNVANLFCAGRNISATHAAMSSTRVMATCSLMGQAVGTAAALAARHGLMPRDIHEHRLVDLQRQLMDDDCWLPWKTREIPMVSRPATLTASMGDPSPLRNGADRPVGGLDNGWSGSLNSWVQYDFGRVQRLSQARLVFDSHLNRERLGMRVNYPLDQKDQTVPPTLVRSFRLEIPDAQGNWRPAARIEDNHQRLVRVPLTTDAPAIRFVPESTWGSPTAHLFAFDVR